MYLSSVILEYLSHSQAKLTRILAQSITETVKRHKIGAWITLVHGKTSFVFIEKDPPI